MGYAAGFARAVEHAAELGYDAAYEENYARAYRDRFREWSENPKPAIESLELVDTEGDGTLRAGEAVTLRFVVVNYGGAGGRFAVSLAGALLAAPVRSEVALQRRRRHDPESLDTTLEPSAPPGSIGEIRLAVGPVRRALEVEIGGFGSR